MQIIKTTSVRIDIRATLETMEVGETWAVPASVNTAYLRVLCSTYSSIVNKSFTVSAKCAEQPTVTRTR